MSIRHPAKSRLGQTPPSGSRVAAGRFSAPFPLVYLLRCSVALCGRWFYTDQLAGYPCPACDAPLTLEAVTDLRQGLLPRKAVAS